MNRRVLFIGYYHSDANMGGVRMRRLARLLPRHGWDPTVLTHTSDSSSIIELQKDVRIEEVGAFDLTRSYRRLSKLRAGRSSNREQDTTRPKAQAIGFTSELNRWLMIPDKQITWRAAAVRRGLELLKRDKYSAIFASLDPRTSLLVATRLARLTGLPCVLEYRDLWTGNPYYHITQPTAFHRWVHQRLERNVLRQADRVSCVCRGIADYLSTKHGRVLKSAVSVNYNFFDPDEYPVIESGAEKARPFTISYTGAMYASRTPHQFFKGLRAFIDATRLRPDQFRFCWAGGAAGINDLDAILEETGVRPYLEFIGQVPHREALALLQRSDASLLIQSPDDTIHIPGKLFEAMGARVPLLALANASEVTEIIERCRAGVVAAYKTESVAAVLSQLYRLVSEGRRWEFNENEVSRFSAAEAVGGLAELFNQVTID